LLIFKKIDRWDSPLFEIRENEPTPLKEIAQVILFEEKKAKDPISTKSVNKKKCFHIFYRFL